MTVGVVGLGLIGGSIGLALRDPDRLIVGYDPNPANAQVALDRSCVDKLVSLAEVAQSDVVFVAAPPAHVVQVLSNLEDRKAPETILTDCTSVKQIVADWGMEVKDSLFVPGHPMAGHEKSGPGFSSAWMFRGARWILSPLPMTSKPALAKVEALVVAMGASPVRLRADQHDRHVAIVSHLPHAVAGALVQFAEELENTGVAGGSWRDLTRVGGVDPALWTQIFMANRVELGRILGEMSKQMAKLESDVMNGDEAAIGEFFKAAQRSKAKQSELGKAPQPVPANRIKGRKRK
jgi:prephenate dehydrogenase